MTIHAMAFKDLTIVFTFGQFQILVSYEKATFPGLNLTNRDDEMIPEAGGSVSPSLSCVTDNSKTVLLLTSVKF